MFQDLADDKQLRLCEDRSASFRGTGRVELDLLDFQKTRENVPSKNVARLRQVFRNEGCFPLEPENRIVAIVSPEKLNEVLRASAVTNDQLLDSPSGVPPVLKIPRDDPLRCLDGRSRIEAAKGILVPGKRYWAVDFYLQGGCCSAGQTYLSELTLGLKTLQPSLSEYWPSSIPINESTATWRCITISSTTAARIIYLQKGAGVHGCP